MVFEGGRWMRMNRMAVLVAVIVLASGCGSGGGDESDAALVGDPLAAVVEGLATEGQAPTLSWQEFKGAAVYQVTSAREDGSGVPWIWVGAETEVVFGEVVLPELEEGAEDVDFARAFVVDEATVVPERGATYRWSVAALDDQGRAVGSSDVATFTCSAPCGTE